MHAFVIFSLVSTKPISNGRRSACHIGVPLSRRNPLTSDRRTTLCTATSPNDEPHSLPRFRKDDDDPSVQPLTSFFPHLTSDSSETMTPNTRVLKQVQETMDRLGISQAPPTPAPPSRPIDISNVNPVSPFMGAIGAAVLSVLAWNMLETAVRFAASHPMDDQVYIVQRVTAVIRTALVSLFALASGFSGVTSLGLALLALRTSYAAITKEFDKSSESKPSTKTSSKGTSGH